MTPTHFGGEIGYVAPGFVRLYQTSTLSPGVRRLSSALKRVVQTVGRRKHPRVCWRNCK